MFRTRSAWMSVLCIAMTMGLVSCADPIPSGPPMQLPDDFRLALLAAVSWDLYSIDPDDSWKLDPDHSKKAPDGFHNFKVLGKLSVQDGGNRKLLMTALEKGVAENAAPAACFWPRHGIRVKYDEKVYDFLICFECHHIKMYLGDQEKESSTVGDSPEALFTRILKNAGVTLPKAR